MPQLNMPAVPDLKVRRRETRDQVFDPVRRKWVALTPEEWVRQHTVHLLLERAGVADGLIAIEKELVWEGTRRRADIVVFSRAGRPWMVVECKAPSVPVTQGPLDQASRYNRAMGARYVIVTNGLQLVGWEVLPDGGHRALQDIPTAPSSS